MNDYPDWHCLTHSEALTDHSWLDETSVVINCAFDQRLAKEGYQADWDFDSRIAEIIAGRDISYVMLSTRKVYGTLDNMDGLKEDQVLKPDSPYGEAKVQIEKNLKQILPVDRLMILRLANIFGSEYRRKTFFGYALTRLIDQNEIMYDFNPAIGRDFFSTWAFSQALGVLATNFKGGVFNLGSGYATQCQKIADWLIDANQGGVLNVSDSRNYDPFYMDMSKTKAAFDIENYSEDKLKDDCIRALSTAKSDL